METADHPVGEGKDCEETTRYICPGCGKISCTKACAECSFIIIKAVKPGGIKTLERIIQIVKEMKQCSKIF